MPAAFWIAAGILVLLALCGRKGTNSGKNAGKNPGKGSRDKPVRIDRPHYYDLDDYECSVCGARFRKKSMTCPRCGARFEGTKTDEEAFTEEFVLWDDDDD